MACARFIVTGRVQGVFFRAWTREQADRLGVKGWIRNCPDGSVELLAIGGEIEVERMVDACRGGPPAATVQLVQTLAADDDGTVGFQARA